ncbi:MAG: hypothetical protein ACI9KE_006158 [Polyangiales bacterium]
MVSTDEVQAREAVRSEVGELWVDRSAAWGRAHLAVASSPWLVVALGAAVDGRGGELPEGADDWEPVATRAERLKHVPSFLHLDLTLFASPSVYGGKSSQKAPHSCG